MRMRRLTGSRGYMAPEVLRATQPYDPRGADIWASGVLLFAALTKTLPFTDDMFDDPRFDSWQLDKRRFWRELRENMNPTLVLSEAATSFLEGLMECDVNRRLNADASLEHPFCRSAARRW